MKKSNECCAAKGIRQTLGAEQGTNGSLIPRAS